MHSVATRRVPTTLRTAAILKHLTQKLILGLDIGTSSVRAALYDLNGEMLPSTLVKNERALDTTEDGGSEIDAEVALRQVVKVIDEVLRGTKGVEIAYIASCAFWHSLVGVDTQGKPTTTVYGWSDTRSSTYTRHLRRRFDETEVHNRTGARFHSSFWPAKLLWLRKELPDAFERTSLWLSFSDFIALRLFGVATTSISMASGTGVFDIRSCHWDTKLPRFLGVKRGGLPLISDGSYTYRLDEKYRKRWPRLKTAEWFPAIADGAANNIGTGCVKPSTAALMIGTSGAMRVVLDGDPPEDIPSGLWCYRIDRTRAIVGGALSDGGGLYAWLKDRLAVDLPDGVIGKEIAERGADAHGLTMMPFFAGERSTGYHDDAAGSIVGLRSSHDAIDILQSAMESIAFRFAEIFDQIKQIAPAKRLVVSGGALESSAVWRQIVADVLGHDIAVFRGDEASMRGAVLLALESLGKIESIQRVSTETDRTRFHPKCHKIYKAARKRHTEHYDILIRKNEHSSTNG